MAQQPRTSAAALQPGAQPVERIWHYLRSHWLANSVFTSLADIMDACETAWSRFAAGNHVGRVAVIRVAQPGLYVDISTEIGLGVIVAATVNHIILPSSLGPQLWQAVIGGRQALADYALARSPDHRGGWKGKHLRQGTCHYPDAKEYAAGGITDRRVRLISRDHSVWQGS